MGASQGAHDNGEGEVSDALAAVIFLSEQQVIDEGALALMGYSFGGAVALTAAMESELIKAAAAVSPAGIPELDDKKPRLVICGTEDELIPHTTVLREQEAITGGGVGSIELISGADHFWHGYEQHLARLITNFMVEHLMD